MSASAWVRPSAASPLLRYSAAQRDALVQRLLPSWRAWCDDWSLARADLRVEPLVQGTMRVRPAGGWSVVGRLGAGGVVLRESGRDAMTRAAMDLPAAATWTADSLAASFAESVEASWRAWRDGWLGSLAPATGAPMENHPDQTVPAGNEASASDLGELVLIFSCVRAANGSDAEPVERMLRIAASSLVALLPAVRAGVTPASTAHPALSPLPRAIAHLPVRVRVSLEQASLQMGQLIELQPGDVIPLAHPLARPAALDLAGPSGHALAARARLGRRGAHWAVRVDPAPPADS